MVCCCDGLGTLGLRVSQRWSRAVLGISCESLVKICILGMLLWGILFVWMIW